MIDAYVYTITNKLTGEFYHGYRYRNQTLGIVPKDDLWITYFTSSNRIKNDIKKYGKTAFITFSRELQFIERLEAWRTFIW